MNQGNRGARFVDADGRLWFGTVGGAVAFDPAREIADRSPNVLRLAGERTGCDDCEIWDGQLFAHDQNRFRVRLALLSYFAEPLTRDRTELEGSDVAPSEWSRGAEREVMGLGPGRYVFRAWGRDGAGNVSGPVELAFVIRPAPWQTPGARLAAALVIAGLVALLFRQRARVQARREHDLQEKVEARTRQLQRANDHLIELSYVDPLTSVPNRRRFDELFEKEWQRSVRAKVPLGLVLLDLDGFKAYNDRFGHQRGDEALKQVASALADGLVRSGDLVARYGGEEFAAILPATDGAGAMQVAENLRRRVEELAIPHAAAERRRALTMSCGAVSTVATLDDEPGDLFRRADEALYRAKRAGGNRTEAG
jgi:diguanylate cyclase (GGDEF)-like protein